MRSGIIFYSFYLGRCLRSGWYLDILMLLLLGDTTLMFRFVSAVDLGYWDHTFDDRWLHVTRFLTYYIYDVILGHIPFWVRFIDLHRVACLSLLARCTPIWLTYSLFYDDSLVEPLGSHSSKSTLFSIQMSLCFLPRDAFSTCGFDFIMDMDD